MISYRVTLDVPFQLAVFVSGLLGKHRAELGTRTGTRALTCWKHAIFTLAWFRYKPDIRRLGEGSGISQATSYRYKDEAIEVLAARAPKLRDALEKAVEQGLPYLVLDGTLISVGAGPGGLAAAVYGACEGMATVLGRGHRAGRPGGNLIPDRELAGFPAGLSGEELAARAALQAQKFGVRIKLGCERCRCHRRQACTW